MTSYHHIAKSVEALGLCLRGGFVEEGKSYILIGNIGSRLWDTFGAADQDWVEPHPLDEWTKRHIDPLADHFSAQALYPFQGPPFAPFQRWALRADTVFTSPIGPLIHPQYGLWHAYRAALVFPEIVDDIAQRGDQRSPCETCCTKPCLTHCPVGAFSHNGLALQQCLGFLKENPDGSCMNTGCLARLACPVGAQYRYRNAHARFHMNRFLDIDFG